MKVLGIDQSYACTGLVICEDEEIIHGEVYKTTTENDTFMRSYLIAAHIAKVAKKFEVDYIMMEGLSYAARGDVTRDLAGLMYTIVVKLNVVQRYELEIIPPTTLKKFASGYGFAKKENMIDALPDAAREYFESLGVKKTTGLADLADAYWLSQMYWREYA